MTTPCDHLADHGLLALELDLPDPHLDTCVTCRAELPRYRFIDDLPRVAALWPAPAGWEQRVWAAIAAEDAAAAVASPPSTWRRWLATLRDVRWIAAPVMAAAAVALFFLLRPAPTRPGLGLDIEVQPPTGLARRAVTAAVGDAITVRAPGAAAIWVYREGAGLIVRCPDPVAAAGAGSACRVSDRGAELTFLLATAARHRVLVLSTAAGLTPTGDVDRDALAARSLGAHVRLRSIAVPW